jgi:hypothetical protein
VHVAAFVCLFFGYLTGFHWLTGDLDRFGERLWLLAVSPLSGGALAALAVMLAAGSELLVRSDRRRDGLWYVAGAGAAALLALVLVSLGGQDIPGRAALVFGLCGLGALAINLRWQQPLLTFVAAAVLQGAFGYTLLFINPAWLGARLAILGLLSEVTFLLIVSTLLEHTLGERREGQPDDISRMVQRVFAAPLWQAALLGSVLAVAPLLFVISWDWLIPCGMLNLWLGALYVVLAWRLTSPVLLAACQTAVTGSVLFAVTAWLHEQPWVGSDVGQLVFHFGSLQAYALGLGILSLFWMAVRRLLAGSEKAQSLLEPGWPTVDWAVFGTTVVGQLTLAVIAVVPHALKELTPRVLHANLQEALQADLDPSRLAFQLDQAWILMAVLALAMVLALWERRPYEALLGLVILAITVPVLIALAFVGETAGASAWRWSASLCYLLVSGVLWARARLGAGCERFRLRLPTQDVARESRALLLVGAVAPVLILTFILALIGFAGRAPAGPDADSLFGQMGRIVSTLVPLVVIIVAMVGHAVREDLAGYIFTAGQVLLASVTGGYALGIVLSGEPFDDVAEVVTAQLGLLAAAGWLLAWLKSGRWQNIYLLATQLGIGAFITALLLLGRLFEILDNPDGPFAQTGHILGWAGLLAIVIAGCWFTRGIDPTAVVHAVGAGGMLVSILAACTVSEWIDHGWAAHHTLMLGWALTALVLVALGWAGSRLSHVGPLFWTTERRAGIAATLKVHLPAFPTEVWATVLATLVILLAIGGAWSDPGRPYWSAAAVLAVSSLFAALAIWTRQSLYVYASGLMINLTGYLVWQSWVIAELDLLVVVGLGPGLYDRFLIVQALSLGIASACWTLVEWKLRQRTPPVDLRGGHIPFTHAAVWLAVHLMAILILTGVVADLTELGLYLDGGLPWLALAVTLLALVFCYWDPEARLWALPEAPLYVSGLLTIGLALHQLSLGQRLLGWWAGLLLAGYVFLAAGIVWLTPRLAPLWRRLHLPPRPDNALPIWFLPAQAVDFERVLFRLAAPLAVALLLMTSLLHTVTWPRLANPHVFDVKLPRFITLLLFVMTCGILSWALIDPDGVAAWLHRSAALLAALTVLAGWYLSGLKGIAARDGDWAAQARQLAPRLAELAAIVLALVLAQELILYDKSVQRTPMAWPAVVLVAGLLAGVIVAAIWQAVLPEDPPRPDAGRGVGVRGWSKRTRMACVYGAELLVVVLIVHLRLTAPHLFRGFLAQHWPFVLIVLGFVAVGVAELLQRRGLSILAEPFFRTGIVLPLFPLFAYLLRPLADIDEIERQMPALVPLIRFRVLEGYGYGVYSLMWFLLALLYSWVALMRRSSTWALLAGLVANFGLWVLFAHQEELSFWLHPQLWLIPVGVIFLVAEHLNRVQLTPGQSQGVRYMGLTLIYLSSTADMFIAGIGHSPLFPIILAVLSICGVLAGILLRVRAFLFLGIGFLFLVVFSQIWHAAVDRQQTWVWWASGIVLGVAILTLFALFEKRKNEILKMLEELKRWQ